MKIAITGHRKGIGQAFAEQLSARGHEIVGISRSDGENIRRTAHTANLIEPCDMLINNAISMYAQTELLFEVWHRWQNSEHTHYLWNISTKVCEWKGHRYQGVDHERVHAVQESEDGSGVGSSPTQLSTQQY